RLPRAAQDRVARRGDDVRVVEGGGQDPRATAGPRQPGRAARRPPRPRRPRPDPPAHPEAAVVDPPAFPPDTGSHTPSPGGTGRVPIRTPAAARVPRPRSTGERGA